LADSWRFELEESVGRGTSGVVWRAKDRRTGQPVALKVARDELGASTIAHEAETLLIADSALVPSVIDLGRVPAGVDELTEGATYVALQWMPGERLQPQRLDDDDRWAVAVAIARDVGGALDDLHRAGVAHGDVKPDNVLVSAGGDGYRAVLVDLGYATAASSDALLGATIRYAPPELARGQRRAVAHDLWALGVCIAETIDGTVAQDDDPVKRLWSRSLPAPFGSWARALTAAHPSARPPASWICAAARRASSMVPVDASAGPRRVRASYLRVRHADLSSAREADAVDLRTDVASWMSEALDVVRTAHTLCARVSTTSDELVIEPLDAAGRKRWLVALVGVGAVGWPLPPALMTLPESKLASVLERLAVRLEPARWTLQDVVRAVENDLPTPRMGRRDTTRDPVELALGLVRRPTDPAMLEAAEDLQRNGELPERHHLLLADALRSLGQMGRAYAVIEGRTDPEAAVLRAELLRRMGRGEEAAEVALNVGSGDGADGSPGKLPESVVERARSIRARILLDRGDPSGSLALISSVSGAHASEVRALAYLARGEQREALQSIEQGLAVATDDEVLARLFCVRGMEAHARGQSQRAYASFARAAEHAERAGAVEEEAVYQTGLSAAAVDAGRPAMALDASMRASLLWEHLEQPSKLAYALLARAAAFALVGDEHDARKEAERALGNARESGDKRATAYVLMLMSDVAADGSQEARRAAEAARAVLEGASVPDDELRVAARLLRAECLDDDAIRSMDGVAQAADMGVTAQAEWWSARARGWVRGRRIGRDADIVIRLMRLVREPLPLGVKGPALDAARALAASSGDGESTRVFSSMQVKLSLDLLEHVPSWLREHAVSVSWILEAHAGGDVGVSAEQARNLESLVRSLAGRESLRRLLEQALDALVLWTGVERGLLLLRAPNDKLVVRAARNLERQDLREEQLELSQSLAKRALTTGDPVVAVDAAGELTDVHNSVHALGLRSVLAVPLMARGEALGVAYLDDRVRVGAFGPQELSWVRLVAGIAAMAITDARSQLLLRREARRAKRAEAQVKEALARREAELDLAERELASEGRPRRGYEAIVGESVAVRSMLSLVDRVAAADLPVLIQGESGSGKELVARALHQHSPRVDRPFVTENCSAIPEPLFESTLFGHTRGAFTGADRRRLGLFEAADGGTLFLDEVGEIPLHLQSKLLRVLQDGEVHPLGSPRASRVDVRVIAATNRELRDRVEAGTFREDLFYRLNVFTISVPSLRERIEDVPQLVRYFLSKYGQGRAVKVSRGAWSKLESYGWPGNVRQLENEIRRALVLSEGVIRSEDLTMQVRGDGSPRAAVAEGMNLKARVDALERSLVQEALGKTGGNQTRAARMLGVSRYGLQKMIKRLGIG
jgi:transcriptional regulator with GAF, ATPase, and Fis domain/serine/threonine protein kinase